MGPFIDDSENSDDAFRRLAGKPSTPSNAIRDSGRASVQLPRERWAGPRAREAVAAAELRGGDHVVGLTVSICQLPGPEPAGVPPLRPLWRFLRSPPPERRKLATLVFCDLWGSTAMGEWIDAEAVRSLMLAYFQEMRTALERHGGTVEKFVGDAVLSVFGVPEAHEDDALRACRAALEMQARLPSLNEEFERRFGRRIALRIGVNTGEVVAGDPSSRETFVTGDAVNVAARLEQAAEPGEVLVGEATFALVRHAVRAEAVAPVRARGKSEPVGAYRLLEVIHTGPMPQRTRTPFTGRETHFGLLEQSSGQLRATAAGHRPG